MAGSAAACDFASDRSFIYPDAIRAFDEADRYGYADEALYLGIKSPGATIIYLFDECGTNGAPASFNVSVRDTSGWGEIMILIQTGDGSEWVFNVDPQSETWSLYRTSDETGQFFYWIEPISYAGRVDGALDTMSVIATEKVIRLQINGKTVADSRLGVLPEISGSLIFGFGIGINPYSLSGSGKTFEASFERVTLTDLR